MSRLKNDATCSRRRNHRPRLLHSRSGRDLSRFLERLEKESAPCLIGPFEAPSGDLPNDGLSFNRVNLASTRQGQEEEKEEDKEEGKKEEEEGVSSLAASRMAHTGIPARSGGGFSGSLRCPPSILNLNLRCQS